MRSPPRSTAFRVAVGVPSASSQDVSQAVSNGATVGPPLGTSHSLAGPRRSSTQPLLSMPDVRFETPHVTVRSLAERSHRKHGRTSASPHRPSQHPSPRKPASPRQPSPRHTVHRSPSPRVTVAKTPSGVPGLTWELVTDEDNRFVAANDSGVPPLSGGRRTSPARGRSGPGTSRRVSQSLPRKPQSPPPVVLPRRSRHRDMESVPKFITDDGSVTVQTQASTPQRVVPGQQLQHFTYI
jgi:hypothetical protein